MTDLRTILIADDDEDDRFLVKSALEESVLRFVVQFVENGTEVLDYLENKNKFSDTKQFQKPSLILLDLNMPRKDGRETLKEIKSNPRLKTVPIIVLTTSKAIEDVNLCYGLGANGYVVKPSTFTGLSETLQVLTSFWLDIVTLPPI
jgi:CheY-like chemotaxis protein